MKICQKCKESRLITDYSHNSRCKDGLQAWCKFCYRVHDRARYNRNPQKYIDQKRGYRQTRVGIINELKSVPCTDCGVTYPSHVMDFDHLPQYTKSAFIHRIKTSWTLHRVLEEIKKCEVVCANCHRQRTYNRSHSPH